MRGKVVVITGGFGALGSAVAKCFAKNGAAVALVDVACGAPGAVQFEFAAPHILLPGTDLTSLESARAAMESVGTRAGGIDVLVNVAGGFRWQTLADGDVANWDLLYSMNLKTAVVATKAALPHLIKRGCGRIAASQ